jgi:DNA ligase-1
MRFNAIVRGQTVEFRSRNGREIIIPNKTFAVPFIKMAEHYKQDMVFDGELLIADFAGKPVNRQTGNGILSKAIKGTMSDTEALQVRATLWDCIPYDSFKLGIDTEPYNIRLAKLLNAMSDMKQTNSQFGQYVDMVWTKEVNELSVAKTIFENFLAQGQEGTILKSKTGIWEDKRSKEQIKFKGELECELRVVDWEEGTGKNKGRLGALVCEGVDDGKDIRVNVGSGLTDEQRVTFWDNAVTLIGDIAEVRADAITQNQDGTYSLRFPRFKGFRGFEVGEKI